MTDRTGWSEVTGQSDRVTWSEGATQWAQSVTAHRWLRLLVAAILGAGAALGQAPWDLWPLTVLGMALVYGLLLAEPDWKRVGVTAWVAGTGHYLVGFSWVVEPFLVDVARYGWMAPFALVFLSGGMALYWGIFAAIGARIGLTGPVFVAALTLGEWARGWLFTGFPWAQLGHVWIDTPVLAWASVGGSLLLTAALLALSVALWPVPGRRSLSSLIVVGVFVLAWFAGPFLYTAPLPQPSATLIRVVQPNAAQHEKWDPDKIGIFFNRQLHMTAKAPRPALVVWPETSIPFYLDRAQDAIDAITLAAGGSSVVIGANMPEGDGLYNTLAVVEPDGQLSDIYKKHHLVPFGEFLPFADFMARLGVRALADKSASGYRAGPGPAVIDIPGVGRAVPLICYEDVFARDVRGMPERGDFLLMITNDAWFGKVSGPYQHLAQSRLRSVEVGLPMLRSANTGISAVIDASGEVTAALPLDTTGYLDTDLPPAHAPTLYARVGDLPMVILLSLILALSALRGRQRSA